VTTTVEDALDLARAVQRTGLIFGLTHTYTGYPMARQARAIGGGGTNLPLSPSFSVCVDVLSDDGFA